MRHTFTYIADGVRDKLVAGARVQVPFGKGTAAGFYVGERSLEDFRAAGFDPAKLKPIAGVFGGAESSLTPALVKLARWMSRHYICPLGVVLKSMLPSGVKEGTVSRKTRFISTHLSANELLIHATRSRSRRKSKPRFCARSRRAGAKCRSMRAAC